MRFRNPLWGGLAVLLLGNLTAMLLAFGSVARAETAQNAPVSAEVAEALGRMNKTLQADKFSFQANTLRVYAGSNGELLHIGHKIEIAVHRPDRLLVNAAGDDGSSKMFYDGKNLAVYGVDQKQYVLIPTTGEIEEMVDTAESRFGLDMPLADFVSSDPQKTFLAGLTSGGQVGTSTIDGIRCRHLFFTQTPDLEMELWLEDNERSLPRRLIVTYESLPGRPRFIAELSNWEFSGLPDTAFVFQPPPGVKQVELAAGSSSPPPATK